MHDPSCTKKKKQDWNMLRLANLILRVFKLGGIEVQNLLFKVLGLIADFVWVLSYLLAIWPLSRIY